MKSKVWFVTGASKGLGRSIVSALLAQGHKVAATSRQISGLAALSHENLLPLQVDLGDEKSVAAAVQATTENFGRIDVLINNAGYGQAGALEELSDAEARANFDVNVFGLLNTTRAVMPVMRAQKSGHIFNISSVAGVTGSFPGFGIYCATKFAVVGLTEALAEEGAEFGIKATVVMPGYFRTDFLTSGSLGTPANPIADYTAVRAVQQMHEQEINHNQPGDPDKAATAIIAMAAEATPALHLYLGADAYQLAKDKLQGLLEEVEQWKEVTVSTELETV
ncbi:NADP-dependent 3-hydroxy acid dehydrogenase YdfG [Chitinophaga jiangningensis]|uniref:NADP-dependent 3-hydroxy acid dehydrogenase YdfG n=1 Tax=Chitinophaga jiangningensis TaxID=1419482 RepID=A0A1M7ABE0_9BACT|nr:oxidoreductase [Chitinophaga jiangningensis]SHL40057.1 NADP-dependent 3-hydroxy acid dehydrogenase YdfG [Chitinophaga jiangningensis]